jgi:hypothetical protein
LAKTSVSDLSARRIVKPPQHKLGLFRFQDQVGKNQVQKPPHIVAAKPFKRPTILLVSLAGLTATNMTTEPGA